MQTHKLISAQFIQKYLSWLRAHKLLVSSLALILICLCGASSSARASTLVSQTYTATDKPAIGSIVSLEKNSTDHVKSASIANSNYILGVVITSDSSQLSISSSNSNQVNVATNGVEQILVSDINGNIVVGDPITASPIAGIGMKASGNVKIIGVAQDSFPNNTATKGSYTDKNKNKQSVMLGSISVLVNVSYYYKQPDKTVIPTAVQNVANALAGKKVNPLPIIISISIFIVTLLVVVSIVYSLIHSSIISVGRNPMSQAAVYRNVIQLSVLVIFILGVAVGSIYMVLTKF
jgi:hypothetical protein